MKLNYLQRITLLAVCLVGLGTTQIASATIISATGVTATNSNPSSTFGTPENMINQGGLQTGYTSGVTDFDTYLATNPLHTPISAGAEWFTDFGIPSATLTFDLGIATVIDGLAVWVDEFWGAGNIDVAVSLDNIGYTGVGGFMPTDWATSVSSYGADVFTFGAMSARYVQLALTNCPQPNSVSGGGCGMGEVAFRQGVSVPEPSTLGLLGLGLALVAFSRRRAIG